MWCQRHPPKPNSPRLPSQRRWSQPCDLTPNKRRRCGLMARSHLGFCCRRLCRASEGMLSSVRIPVHMWTRAARPCDSRCEVIGAGVWRLRMCMPACYIKELNFARPLATPLSFACVPLSFDDMPTMPNRQICGCHLLTNRLHDIPNVSFRIYRSELTVMRFSHSLVSPFWLHGAAVCTYLHTSLGISFRRAVV